MTSRTEQERVEGTNGRNVFALMKLADVILAKDPIGPVLKSEKDR